MTRAEWAIKRQAAGARKWYVELGKMLMRPSCRSTTRGSAAAEPAGLEIACRGDVHALIVALHRPWPAPELALRLVCLDSGCGNYDQLWLTTSLRALVGGTLTVAVLEEGVHSGDASGIVPSSFRILRQLLSRLEDEASGAIRPAELSAQIPAERLDQARAAAALSTVSNPHPPVQRKAGRCARRLLTLACTDIRPDELTQPALVFSPHPDDESLGCGGVIRKKTRAGANVKVVHMTDGAASTDLIPREELKAMRKQECLSAGRVLGVRDTIFLEYEDSKLWDRISPATNRVADIIATMRPEQVFVPYRHEPTKQAADHVATTKIVRAALRRASRRIIVWEYPVWAWLHWPWVGLRQSGPLIKTKHVLWNSGRMLFGGLPLLDWRRSVDVSDVLEEKRSAIAQHRSQVEKIVAHPGYMTLSDICHGEWIECLRQDREYFRVYTYPG